MSWFFENDECFRLHIFHIQSSHLLLLSDLVFFSQFWFCDHEFRSVFQPLQGFHFMSIFLQVCSAYCDVTIKLSSAGISLPNEACASRFWSWIEKHRKTMVPVSNIPSAFSSGLKKHAAGFFICHLRQVLYNVHGVGSFGDAKRCHRKTNCCREGLSSWFFWFWCRFRKI